MPYHLDKELQTSTHVWVQCDSVHSPFQTRYNGPYLVLDRNDKVFVLDIKVSRKTVLIDRLKVAHLPSSNPVLYMSALNIANKLSPAKIDVASER